MKKYIVIFLLFASLSVYAQYKEPPFPTESVKDGIVDNSSSVALFGFLNSENFQMNHSYNLSYSSFGGSGLALGVYTNSMMYKFSQDFNIQLDASFVHSPYNTFGENFKNSIDGFYISKAALNYKPWEDVFISVQYRNIPNVYLNPYYGIYGGGYGFRHGYSPFTNN